MKEKDKIESAVSMQVYEEFLAEERNQADSDSDFESVIDILECKRTEKDYDWMSDVFIPEFPSIHLTEASQWANQYFQSRDFVEVYLGSGSPEDLAKAKACKRYINNMLNMKKLFHYHKYMRARSINSMRGYVIAVCGWKQELETQYSTQATDDGMGGQRKETTSKTIPIEDHFYYEIPDPRNVRFDSTYCYSIQDKSWITIRSELSLDKLYEMQDSHAFFNLDKVEEMCFDTKTDAKKATEKNTSQTDETVEKVVKTFDVLERFGKAWAIVDEYDDYGYPVKARPGVDEGGKKKDGAKLIETIITVVYSGDSRILIRFQPTPFRTKQNVPYRPVIRGLCYIHPTKDVGMSDGLYGKEMQVLINDMINLGIDRTKLATFPTLKMKRYAFDDNDSVYFEPEHPILVDEMTDIEEFKIQDNIAGALDVVGLGINKLQQVSSIYPTTMGDMPGKASTTATAVAGAESKTNLRANYKSLTFEYTFFQDFYWMMLQMGYQFMHQDTLKKLLGELSESFAPDEDYNYQPVTTNIEVEYNKDKKLQRYDGILGRISNIPNPAIVPIVAHIVARQLELLGDEYQTLAPMVEKLAKTPNQDDKKEEGNAPKDAKGMPESNQTGNAMSMQEQSVRGM